MQNTSLTGGEGGCDIHTSYYDNIICVQSIQNDRMSSISILNPCIPLEQPRFLGSHMYFSVMSDTQHYKLLWIDTQNPRNLFLGVVGMYFSAYSNCIMVA